jgi:hypothetical protein
VSIPPSPPGFLPSGGSSLLFFLSAIVVLTGFPSPLGAERPQIITGGTNTPEWKQLPAPIRDKVDFVHLFLHYRASRPKTAEYVERRNDFRTLRSLMLSMHTIASGGVTCGRSRGQIQEGAVRLAAAGKQTFRSEVSTEVLSLISIVHLIPSRKGMYEAESP